MRPLRIAWRQQARRDEPVLRDVHVRGLARAIAPWRGHAIVPWTGRRGAHDLGIVLDRDGGVVRMLDVPPYDRPRRPFGVATTWPDEGLVLGVQSDSEAIGLHWLDLGEHVPLASQVADKPRTGMMKTLVATTDGAIALSTGIADVDLSAIGWPAEITLHELYEKQRRWAFDDQVYTTACHEPAKRRWAAPGRVTCIADEVVVLEEGAASAKQIVARLAVDGRELWRQAGPDRFVLGTMPVPAWSDDRLYVYDRAARRSSAWERERALARAYQLNRQQPLASFMMMSDLGRARRALAVDAPSRLACTSARTGATRWQIELAGDVVSFFAHPSWVACIVASHAAGTLEVWRHDGTSLAVHPIAPDPDRDPAEWPPDPTRWPCIVHGDADHVVLAQNRARRAGGPRLYAVRITTPERMDWELRLPVRVVLDPEARWLRLLNRAPIAFTDDVAYLRAPSAVFGLGAGA